MNSEQFKILRTLCKEVMRCDQYPLLKRIQTLETRFKKGQDIAPTIMQQLTEDIENSLKQRQLRARCLPQPEFPDDLPVSQQRERIAAAIATHPVVILAGETGSGKTTQLPKICLTLGRGISGLIGCTQPRRIAARTMASRIAHELKTEIGHAVGYKVRFSDRLSSATYIKLMTDGILLAETQSDRFLTNYDTLIIDEAHERSLNIDFLLGYLKQLLPKRPDLKLIITSATIDIQRFSAHFGNAPMIEVSGRTYPVETRYRPLAGHDEDEDRNLIQGILDAVDEVTAHDAHADTLIFLSGERDIHDTTEALRKHRLFNAEILPLYARLSTAEQNRVFTPGPQRRIILATNVAETSLTVPRIKAVIDPGLARISRYNIRNKVQRLPIENIARSSANQRKGRCGRIAPGLCIRLYSAEDYDSRPEFTDPEILRTSLAAVILQMLFLRLGDVYEFPFLDPPQAKMINDGFTLLTELGAVDDERRLTEIGRQLAKLPIDPRIGRMILAAQRENCLTEVLVIASALTIQDPRERPLDAQEAADTVQKRFNDETSDFLSFLKLWQFFQEQTKHLSKNKLRKLCHEHFLSYLRMQEWQDIHHQLHTLIKEMGWQPNQLEADFAAIHRALLAGLLGNVAVKSLEEPHYLGTRGLKLFLFPGSGLFKKPPKWLMAAELVETTRLYARCVAKIDPEWIEQVAGHLCQHHYFEPHWEKRPAQVAAFERVTLYGLPIVPKRKMNYGAINPQLSREIFIRQALVAGEYDCTAPFFQHNRQLLAEIELLEHKARRQDILVEDEQIYAFYDARIAPNIYSGQLFEKWLKQVERSQPQLLFLQREDLIKAGSTVVTPQAFPDYLIFQGIQLKLSYHFEPGHEEDGVTVEIPLPLLNQLVAEPFEWLVPGLLEEKIIALLRSLPKSLRKTFVPVPESAQEALEKLKKPLVTFREGGSFLEYPKESLREALSIYCQRRLEQPLPSESWRLETLPPHLLMNFRLMDQNHHFVAMNRDLGLLQQKLGQQVSQTCQQEIAVHSGLERDLITTWDFGELPSQVALPFAGVMVQGFPTLIDQETHVALRVLDHPKIAQQTLRNGLRRLFLLTLPTKKLLKQLAIERQLCLHYLKISPCDQLKEDLLIAIIETVFLVEPLPRNQTAFERRLAEGNARLMLTAQEYIQWLTDILAEYHLLTQQLARSSAPDPILSEIKQHLQSLIYKGFMKEIALEQLKQLPRYLKAVKIRLERLTHDPHKDAKKSSQMMPLWQAYWQHRVKQHPPSTELLEFRWLLEELRVSLFAQELKTAHPVSIQRVREIWDDLCKILTSQAVSP